MPRRVKFNPKRQLADSPSANLLATLAGKVKYAGNPMHKRNPGDFNLTPPSQPRPDKTLCDETGITSALEARRLLREGVNRGLVSLQKHGTFPQNISAVTRDGYPVEAQLENRTLGTYHGYPMPSNDDFRRIVLERWNNP